MAIEIEANEWTKVIAPTRKEEGNSDIFLQPGLSLRGIRARQFAHHEKGVARLNNGSFGSCPALVQAAQAEWKAQHLKQPDAFLNYDLEIETNKCRAAVAELIGASSVEEVALLDNVTTVVAMLAQNLVWDFVEGRFNKGDAVLLLNFAYGAVKACFEGVINKAGGRVVYAKIPFPVSSPSQILECFQNSLQQLRDENPGMAIRLAVVDHITSMPAVLLPVREMVALARRHGVEQVFVDGAHAFGSVSVNVREIDADYYSSNLHKWFFTPPTVAFFHCKPQHLSRLHHPVVSSQYGKGLHAECYWTGTRDYSAILTIPSAVEFVKELGGVDLVRTFNHNSVLTVGKMLAREWKTVVGAPPDMVPSMVMVGVPPELNIQSFEEGLELRTLLRQKFHVEIPLHYVPDEDQQLADQVSQCPGIKAYVRVSHQLYNTIEDYHSLRDAINSLARIRWTPGRFGEEELDEALHRLRLDAP
ncbi:unnamed protein product [Calypogeia fissa]